MSMQENGQLEEGGVRQLRILEHLGHKLRLLDHFLNFPSPPLTS